MTEKPTKFTGLGFFGTRCSYDRFVDITAVVAGFEMQARSFCSFLKFAYSQSLQPCLVTIAAVFLAIGCGIDSATQSAI